MPVIPQEQTELGIAELFALIGRRVERNFTEEMNSLRNDLNHLSSSVSQVQEQQRAEKKKAIPSTSDALPTLLQAVREEIKKAGRTMEQAQTLQNLRVELTFKRLLSTDAHERKDFKEAILAFGRFFEQSNSALEIWVKLMEGQLKTMMADKATMKFTIDQLITAIRELVEIAKNWLPDVEVQKVKDKVKKLNP